MNHVKNTVTLSCSQIINIHTVGVVKLLQCFYVSFRQIHHMDIVTDSSAVRRIVIISKHTDLFELAYSHLSNIRRQIIRDTLRILSDLPALVSAYRIKVTQQDHRPLRICLLDICKNLFKHTLCLAVRIRTLSLGAFLCDRNISRIAVDSRG